MDEFIAEGKRVYVEVGADSVLSGMGRRVAGGSGEWMSSLQRGRGDLEVMGGTLGRLYELGREVRWERYYEGRDCRKVSLPTYPFQRKSFWITVPRTSCRSATNIIGKGPVHPLLGSPLEAASGDIIYQSEIRIDSPAFIGAHRISGQAVLPAAAYVDMLLSGGADIFGVRSLRITDMIFLRPLVIREEGILLQTVFSLSKAKAKRAQVFSKLLLDKDAQWTLHIEGAIEPIDYSAADHKPVIKLSFEGETTKVEAGSIYNELHKTELYYGEPFRGLLSLEHSEKGSDYCVKASIGLPVQVIKDADQYLLHPVILDSAFQAALFGIAQAEGKAFMPFRINRIDFSGSSCAAGEAFIQRSALETQEGIVVSLMLDNEQGRQVAAIEGLTALAAEPELLDNHKTSQDMVCMLQWEALQDKEPLPIATQGRGLWVIFVDPKGIGEELSRMLSSSGCSILKVFAGDKFMSLEDGSFMIDPSEPEHYKRLFEGHHLRGVIYLWSIMELAAAETDMINSNYDRLVDLCCMGAVHILQCLTALNKARGANIFFITCNSQDVTGKEDKINPAQSVLHGLARTASLEMIGTRIVCCDIDGIMGAESLLIRDILSPDEEDQIAYREGKRYGARLKKAEMPKGDEEPAFTIRLKNYGTFDNLVSEPADRRVPEAGELEVRVVSVGLNFRDVLRALGMMRNFEEPHIIASAREATFGFEMAGIVTRTGKGVERFKKGQRVMTGLGAQGCLASHVIVPSSMVTVIPEGLSFEEAATVPVAFMTAWYGLHECAEIKATDSILIHAASGGVGMAALQIALDAGARVYGTASAAKQQRLRDMGIHAVMNSRSLDFHEELLEITGGKGVDIVLNSLKGDYIPKSLALVKKGGAFIEIGKIGAWDSEKVREVRPDVRYFHFDLREESERNPGMIKTMLGRIMSLMSEGRLKPLDRTVFSIKDVQGAFRFMAMARHTGKVVISNPLKGLVRKEGSYLISGGTGGLGLEAASWLARESAREIVLMSRNIPSDAVAERINRLNKDGTVVRVVTGDVSVSGDVEPIIKELERDLRGIIHCAGITDDCPIQSLTKERLMSVLSPKLLGAWNLHQLSMPIKLDFFLCFSSAASILGSKGQAGYSAANRFLDGLSSLRRRESLPSLSISWGPWTGGGMAERLSDTHKQRLRDSGWQFIGLKEGVDVMHALLESGAPHMLVAGLHWHRYLSNSYNKKIPPLFDDFIAEPLNRQGGSRDASMAEDLRDAPAKERKKCISAMVRDALVKALGLKEGDVLGERTRFFDAGLDSLMAVELRNQLEAVLGISLSSTVVFDYPTIEAITGHIESLFDVQFADHTPKDIDHPEDDIALLLEAELDKND